MNLTDATAVVLPCRQLPVKTRGTPLPDSAGELEALARACRRFAEAEAYARATAPVGTEPSVSYTVQDAEGAAYRATVHEPGDLRPGDQVVRHSPSAWRRKRWAARAAAHQRAMDIYGALAATPLMRYRLMDEFPQFPALPRKVAGAVGALRFAELEHGAKVPWLPGYAMGGQGVELLLADGMIFLDMGEAEGGVYVRQIAVAPQGVGLGRRAMLALKRYCDGHNRRLVVYKVATPGFFAALGWLRPDGFSAFVYEPWRALSARPAGAEQLGEEQNLGAFKLAGA